MRPRTLNVLLCVLVFGALPHSVVWAQTYQGGVRGAIRDADGMLPGAAVALVNQQTNGARETVTNEAGEYAFPNVLPGIYTLRVSLTGFKTRESRDIRIGTQEFMTLDLALEIGQISEAVTVVGEAPIIDKTNASMGTLLDRATLETLPNVGRNPFLVSTVAPNVVPTGIPQFVRAQDHNASAMLSLGGGPRRANNYLLDGVPITDIFNRAAIIPSIEAIEELKVQVSTYDAELGRTGGGVFNTTHKSGANTWRGSALFTDRPSWGTAKLFFAERTNQPKPETYYRLWAGSAGGPIVKDRTFFWASTEGYRTRTTNSTVITMPTERERRGDFSQSFDGQGRLIVIYDPLTTRPDPARPGAFIRDAFPGNVIPADRIDRVGRNLVNLLPVPTANRSLPLNSLPISDFTNQATVKIDHRLNGRQGLSGLFAWFGSSEPAPRFYANTPADPGAAVTFRTVNVLALNYIVTPNDRTVAALRYGYLRFRDDFGSLPSDAGNLGFAPGFASTITGFPNINVTGYGVGPMGNVFNGGQRTNSTHYSHSINASVSRLAGRHTLKFGGDYRLIGMRVFSPQDENGLLAFAAGFTQGPDPNVVGTNAGDAMASLLLGFPARGTFTIATPTDLFTNYVGAYVQDDFRIGSNVSVNFGVRYEFEHGMKERADAFTVGFDRQAAFPVQAPGLNLRGGLMYTGVDGYPNHQGDPGTRNFGPRGGIAWSINPETVLRGGYGLFWAPSQVPQALGQAALGTRGFTGSTTYVASDDGGLTPCGGCSLTNPFPNGLEPPRGAAFGLLTGAGGDIDFVDQSSGSAHVHQFSVDLKRELPARLALSIGYLGSRSEGLAVGGTSASTVNINQLSRDQLALGGALQQPVPNPFFGRPEFGAFASQATIPRGQLLRPFPQFANVRAHRINAARSRYHAVSAGLERRQSDGWGMNVNYTLSRRRDNQFGEGNAFSFNQQGAIDNYDLDREFGYSLLDAPHRLNISGTLELPFGPGKRWLGSGGLLAGLLGGWAVTGVGVYQSGFPVMVWQPGSNSGLLGSGQRPDVVPGVEPLVGGNPEDNYDPTCTCIRWLNPAAWSAAAPFTFGDAPRTDPSARTTFKQNWDIALQKTQALGAARLTVRAEVINALNTPTFSGPQVGFGQGTFGTIVGVGGFPRTLQLMVRVGW